jgi:hypothetical protein
MQITETNKMEADLHNFQSGLLNLLSQRPSHAQFGPHPLPFFKQLHRLLHPFLHRQVWWNVYADGALKERWIVKGEGATVGIGKM